MYLLLLILSLIITPVKAVESTGYIFIGDSRTVGMSQAVDAADNVYFVAKVGQGYEWFCDTAIAQVNTIIENNNYDNWVLISNLGVNDLGNAEKYELKYKSLCMGEWRDYDFYIVSVGCIDESKYTGAATNDAIEKFNKRMQYYKNFIDIYDISKREIISKDGLHYDSSVYKLLYDEILNQLN